jgi:protein tyrosine/serine phosphatase
MLAVVVALGAIVLWQSWADLSPKNFGIVAEGKLYRSGWLTPAATHRVVRKHGIRTIVDLGGFDKRPEDNRAAALTAQALGVERFEFRLQGDGTGDPNIYVEALRIITDPSKHPVLVHCSAGSERTGACIMLYRELVEGREREGPSANPDVMRDTRRFGHDPDDNRAMRPYLDQYEAAIFESYRTGKPIPFDIPPEKK